jgi:hypothetical protein
MMFVGRGSRDVALLVGQVCETSHTALWWAYKQGHYAIVDLLFKAGAEIGLNMQVCARVCECDEKSTRSVTRYARSSWWRRVRATWRL